MSKNCATAALCWSLLCICKYGSHNIYLYFLVILFFSFLIVFFFSFLFLIIISSLFQVYIQHIYAYQVFASTDKCHDMARSCPNCLQQSKHCTYITQNNTTASNSNLQSTSCISNSCASSSSVRLDYIFSNYYMPNVHYHCYVYDGNISELSVPRLYIENV